MAGAGRDWPARLVIAAAAFGIGGFLSGVRAVARRLAHAVAAWFTAYVIHAGFLVLAAVIHLFGGPDAPSPFPGGLRDWALAALWALGWALVGAMLVNRWLAPAGRQRVR